jgi:beta-fructofuranosidase
MPTELEIAQKSLEQAIPAAQSDPLRPRYHFAAPANWMNDPNGTIFYRGEYHLFYQLNPFSIQWGNIHWGHAKSPDLVHWEHLPIALAPARELDEEHCFSGCCVDGGDTPVIFYTSIPSRTRGSHSAQQWKATGDHTLTHWQRALLNPAVPQSLHPRKVYDWRDPYIWREDGRWYMVLVGRYFREIGGSVYLYSSADLEEWKFDGRIYQDSQRKLECPNMMKFGERYVLVISPYHKTCYAVGQFRRGKFIPGRWWTLDHGQDFYATNTYTDGEAGYKLVGWLRVQGNGAWNGCLSLPRHLTLDEADGLRIEPVAALQNLRSRSLAYDGKRTVSGNCLEIQVTFSPGAGSECGLELRDSQRSYPLKIDLSSGKIQILNETRQLERLAPGESVELHIFIDYSVIEVFINRREAFSTWLRPDLKQSGCWQVILRQRPETVAIWELEPA